MRYSPAPRSGSPRGARRRAGITLLEVLVSLAIFLFALAAIGQLIRLAGDMAIQAQHRQLAVFKCQSKLSEFASGVLPLSSTGEAPFEEDGDWHWSAECSQDQANSLWRVSVTVSHPAQSGPATAITLTRMMLDPTARGNTMDTPATLSPNSPTSSSTTGNSSSSSSSTTGGGS